MAHQLFQLFLNLLLTGGAYLTLSLPLLAQETPTANIAMWKIESSRNTVYLLGSIHVSNRCVLDSPRISQAMAEAENVVFEIDFTQVSPEEKIQLNLDVAKAGRLREGDRTLKESISPALYERIRQKYNQLKPSNFDISLDTLNQLYRPPFIAMQIQGFQAQKLGLTGECGVDKVLINRAQTEQKTILALETFAAQSKMLQALLNTIPTGNVENEFERLLSDTDNEQVNSLLTSVMTGDLQSVEDKITQSCQSTPKLCYQILDQRNINWMPQIQTYLQDQEDYFIVVGAAHMVGPNSLINLLKNANYSVESF